MWFCFLGVGKCFKGLVKLLNVFLRIPLKFGAFRKKLYNSLFILYKSITLKHHCNLLNTQNVNFSVKDLYYKTKAI